MFISNRTQLDALIVIFVPLGNSVQLTSL